MGFAREHRICYVSFHSLSLLPLFSRVVRVPPMRMRGLRGSRWSEAEVDVETAETQTRRISGFRAMAGLIRFGGLDGRTQLCLGLIRSGGFDRGTRLCLCAF